MGKAFTIGKWVNVEGRKFHRVCFVTRSYTEFTPSSFSLHFFLSSFRELPGWLTTQRAWERGCSSELYVNWNDDSGGGGGGIEASAF